MESLESGNGIKMWHVLVFALIFSVSRAQMPARREIVLTRGYNLGYFGISPSFNSNASGNTLHRTVGVVASKNGRGGISLTGTTSLGLNFGFLIQNKRNHNWWGLNFDLQQNRNSYVYHLPFKTKIPPRDADDQNGPDGDADDDSTLVSTGKWVETDKYLKFSIGIQHMWELKYHSVLGGQRCGFFKVSAGQTFLHRNYGGKVVFAGQTEQRTDNAGNITKAATVSANPFTYMISSEIGICSFSPNKDRSLIVGLAWNLPLNSSFTKQYEFLTKVPGKAPNPDTYQSTGKQNITFQGGSILANLTYNFNSTMHRHPVDTLKLKEKLETPPSEELVIHNHKPHHLEGRKVKIKQTVEVNDTLITLLVWDKGRIDGDRISLFLNGKEILQDYTVGRDKKEVILHLVPGSNYLVMHALNLGRIPPNTAALRIKTGSRDKTITLNSDLKSSGALELVCKNKF